jgi:hypothetical protein
MKHLAHTACRCPTRAPTTRRHPAQRVRQARSRGEPPARQKPAGPSPCTAPPWATMLARMHLAGATTNRQPAQPARPALVERNRARGAAAHWTRKQAALLRAELAYQNHVAAIGLRRAATRPGARRPVPRQRDVRGRTTHGLLRLLLCRRGHLAVRPGRVPERLVHRPGPRAPRRHARPRSCWTPTRPCAR